MSNLIAHHRKPALQGTSALTRRRIVAASAVLAGSVPVFVRLLDEVGSVAFALSGASMVALLVMLPLRCQFDPCP